MSQRMCRNDPETLSKTCRRIARASRSRSGGRQRKHVLLSTSALYADPFIPLVAAAGDIELRLITDISLGHAHDHLINGPCYRETVCSQEGLKLGPRSSMNTIAAELIDWADVFVLGPIDAGMMGSLIVGLTTNLTLTVLRGWDANKPIIMTPNMSVMEWKSLITQRQLDVIKSLWPWVRVLPPMLTQFEEPGILVDLPWEGTDLLVDALKKNLGLTDSAASASKSAISEDHSDDSSEELSRPISVRRQKRRRLTLPPELVLMIFDFLDDWETSRALGIDNKIPVPLEWKPFLPESFLSPMPWPLEYTVLCGSFDKIKESLSAIEPLKPLPDLVSHLILKFSRTDILDYLVTSIPRKEYGPDAVDGASRAGFVNVLEWWRTSGLPLLYTERALEAASAQGHISVLEWWKNTHDTAPSYAPIELKPGKSVLLAAQSGCIESLAWWDASAVTYSHGECVARIASNHGHVHVLQMWYELKGASMIFDNQVLVGATKNGYVDVLEWWKRSGLRVEFKTCDIEEAIEDAVSGAEDRVRQWWEASGLNLGVGMNEWMKVKTL
ncbi:Flavoprotein [Ascosphaera apis ARSEF 7405]|uniref:Flavoprotein n=1 Tax=Ascosphaera apis ARSEF 7405 TaxID=392613 RepID=A0A167ZK75_9EURO|nr:Flavoprotein [Ascosphaera apis ARSEF 7405]